MGNRYEINEWIYFISEPKEPSKELIELKNEFQEAVAVLWDTRYPDCYPSSYDDLAYNAYASLTGMGVGLWQGDEPNHIDFEPTVLNDFNLTTLSQRIENAIFDL